MHEVLVYGEIKALGYREGSSGIFTGSIEGLYEGYRIGSAKPDEREYTLELPNGNLSLTVRQQIPSHLPLPARPAIHPFQNGNDPFKDLLVSGYPKEEREADNQVHTGSSPKPLVMNSMQVTVITNAEMCSGIFAGACGEMRLEVPEYKVGGYLIINTHQGDLYFHFLEKGNRKVLKADLWVDGEKSTGLYYQANGTLHFALELMPPNFARGPYTGTLNLAQEASALNSR
ncbi:MAG TPA: hypothetical protein VHV10_08175 [Ktedonobacteraceae bacterium]|nr:hypothetical protein [Ktedonobacteraceae bacterium]